MTASFAAWLLGCSGGALPSPILLDRDPPPAPPAPGCTPLDTNALRASCAYDRDEAGPVEVRVWPSADPDDVVTYAGASDALAVRATLYDLLARTAYTYEIVDRGEVALAGTFDTPGPPAGFVPTATATIDGLGALGPDDRLLFSLACGAGPALMAIDGEGRLRWYEPTGISGGVTGLDWTDRGTVVASMGRRRVLEVGLDGAVHADLTVDDALPRFVHHAVIGPDDRILALDTEAVPMSDGLVYLVDGVTEIRGGVAEHVWDVGELVDPVGLPGGDPLYWSSVFVSAVDFAHENSIEVLDDGGWLLSFKQLDAIVRLGPAPDHTPEWVVTGTALPSPLAAPTLPLGSSVGLDPTFRHPHHPSPTPWGTFLVVDNGIDESTRVVEFVVDGGAADVIAEWDLGGSCPVQGSAYALDDGTIVATCARSRLVSEVHRDEPGAVRRRTALACSDGTGGNGFVRVRPFTLPRRR